MKIMSQSKAFSRIFIDEFNQGEGLKELNKGISLGELVILHSLSPPSSFPDIFPAKTPKEVFDEIKYLYYPFPLPFKESHFYTLIRQRLTEEKWVEAVDKERKYVLTEKGFLQQRVAIGNIATIPDDERSSDHVILLISSAVIWLKTLNLLEGLSKKALADMRKQFRYSESLELVFLGACSKMKLDTLHQKILKRLEIEEEHLLAKALSDRKAFETAALDELEFRLATSRFFIKGLQTYKDFFEIKAKDLIETSNKNYSETFALSKYRHFAGICSDVLLCFEKVR